MGDVIKFGEYKRENEVAHMLEITKERMQEIENITQNLVRNIDFEKSPYVDIVAMVKRDGFKVKTQEMDTETTGCLLVNDDKLNKQRLIVVNTYFKNPDKEDDVIFKKSRFITAHEYGHFKLHKQEGEPIYAHRDTYHRTEPIELEADYFARSVLMPFSQFKLYYEVLKQFGDNDENFILGILSKIFGVTRNKVQKRVGDLLVLD